MVNDINKVTVSPAIYGLSSISLQTHIKVLWHYLFFKNCMCDSACRFLGGTVTIWHSPMQMGKPSSVLHIHVDERNKIFTILSLKTRCYFILQRLWRNGKPERAAIHYICLWHKLWLWNALYPLTGNLEKKLTKTHTWLCCSVACCRLFCYHGCGTAWKENCMCYVTLNRKDGLTKY